MNPVLTLSLGPHSSFHLFMFSMILHCVTVYYSVPLPLESLFASGAHTLSRVLQCAISGASPPEHKFRFDIRKQGAPNHPVGRPSHRSAFELDIVSQDAISEDGLQFTGCEETTRAIQSVRHRQQDGCDEPHTRHGDHVRKQWCRGTVQPFGA